MQVVASDEKHQQLQNYLNSSDFKDAITLIEQLTRPSIQLAVPFRGVFESRRGAAETAEMINLPGHATLLGSTQLVITKSKDELPTVSSGLVPPVQPDATIAVLAASTRRAVEVTGALLNFIYAAIILVGGYFLFADKWVGTLLDFVTAFFWAYATDIGADAATSAAKGLKK